MKHKDRPKPQNLKSRLNLAPSGRSEGVKKENKSAAARSAVDDVSLNDPLPFDPTDDAPEPIQPTKVWVLLDAEQVPKNGLDYATPEEMLRRIARPKAVSDPAPTSVPRELHPDAGVTFFTVEMAAVKMAMSTNALHLRIRRRARRDGRRVVAHLGGGIVAVQLGRSWRVQFP